MEQNQMEIFYQNQALINYTFNRYFNKYKMYKDDLLQEGAIGLLNSIIKYDDTKGSFSTFAICLIKNSMSKFVNFENRINNNSISFVDDDNENTEVDILSGLLSREKITNYDKLYIQETYNKAIILFTGKNRKIIESWKVNLNYTDIANEFNCSKQYIFKVVDKFKDIFKKYWERGSDLCLEKNV